MKSASAVWLALGASAALIAGGVISSVYRDKQASYKQQSEARLKQLTTWMSEGFDPKSRNAFTLHDLDVLEADLRRTNDPAIKKELEAFRAMRPRLVRVINGEDPMIVFADLKP